MVRHALQDVKPLQRTTLKSTADTNNSFFIFVSVLVNKLDDSFFVLRTDKHASLAVFRKRTCVYPNSATSGDFVDKRQVLLETGRVRDRDGISAIRNDVVRVFKRGDFSRYTLQKQCPPYCFCGFTCPHQVDGCHCSS